MKDSRQVQTLTLLVIIYEYWEEEFILHVKVRTHTVKRWVINDSHKACDVASIALFQLVIYIDNTRLSLLHAY